MYRFDVWNYYRSSRGNFSSQIHADGYRDDYSRNDRDRGSDQSNDRESENERSECGMVEGDKKALGRRKEHMMYGARRSPKCPPHYQG